MYVSSNVCAVSLLVVPQLMEEGFVVCVALPTLVGAWSIAVVLGQLYEYYLNNTVVYVYMTIIQYSCNLCWSRESSPQSASPKGPHILSQHLRKGPNPFNTISQRPSPDPSMAKYVPRVMPAASRATAQARKPMTAASMRE